MKKRYLNLLTATVLILFCFSSAFAATEDQEKVSQMNRQFRKLYEAGKDSAFYQFAHEFEDYLKSTGDWKTYYEERLAEKTKDTGDLTLSKAMRNKVFEMDSVFSDVQNAHYDQLATERALMRAREEAAANKKAVKRLTNWIIVIVVSFLIIYIMGRRRLTRIIWDKNKKLRIALDRAEESNRMKSAFINNMSHEIRTPLNAIGGFSRLLCQPGIDLSEQEKKDMQERITYNVGLITTIVNEVLEFSKTESEKSQRPDSEMSDVAINDLCRKLLHSKSQDSNEGVESRFTTDVADDFTVRTHPSTVNRILTHLYENAQKFTKKGSIELRCEYDKAAGQVLLIVEDTGIGIKPEDRDRIFHRFEKAEGNFKEGIGLGLPISCRLASSIGGEITLDSEYTDGSRFILSLPKKK